MPLSAHKFATFAAAVAVTFISALALHGQTQYAVLDIGGLGGNNSSALGANTNGLVVGSSTTAANEVHGVVFATSTSTLTDIGTLGGTFSQANAINQAGQVVGRATIPGENNHAFLYSVSTAVLTDLGTLGGLESSAMAINRAGQIVGWADTASGNPHAFFYDSVNGGGLVDLGTLGGATSYATWINDAGQIVGLADTSTAGVFHAFIATCNSGSCLMTDLGALGSGSSNSGAYVITNQGLIGGTSDGGTGVFAGFIAASPSSPLVDVGTLGGPAGNIYGGNNLGQFVGDSQVSSGDGHGVLYANGQLSDLNSLIDPAGGWTIATASTINDSGQIAATAFLNGNEHGVLLTPMQTAAATSVVLISSTNPSTVGQSLTFTATVTGTGGTPTGTVTFFDSATSLGAGGLTVGQATLTTSSLVAGSHSITASYGGDSNFSGSASSPALVQVVTGVPVQVSWTTPTAIIYGAALTTAQLDATVSPNIAGMFVYNPPSGTILSAGPHTLSATFTPNDLVDYAVSNGSVQLTVSTAPLAVTANAASRAYGAANPSFTVLVVGAVNGDTFTEALATTATAISGVGPYPITVSNVAGANIADYSLTTNSGTLTINTAPLAVTANAATRVYGAANPSFTVSVVGAVNGDTFTEALATTAMATSGVGPYPITVSNIAGANIADYLVTSNSGTLTISKANTALQLQSAVGAGVETFTATISPATTGVPTGTVTFSYNSATLGAPVVLTSQTAPAVAVLSTDLPFGSDTVTASYGGDANFNASSNPATVSPSFTIGANISTVTLAAGQMSSPITITAMSATGFASQISFSCGSLPVYVHCLFSPITIPATVPTNVTSATSTLVVSVDSTNAALQKQGRIELATAAPLALVGLFSLLCGKRKRWMLYAGMLLLFAGVAGTLAGCASSGSTASTLPPAGMPSIVVNGTAGGGIVVPLNLTINITN